MRLRSLLAASLVFAPGVALATPDGAGQPIDRGHHFQEAVTPVMENIVWLDGFMHIMMFGIVVFVTALMAICIFKFSRKANPNPSTTTHNTTIEVIWTVVPCIILVVIAVPSVQLLFLQLEVPKPDLTIKVTGAQWNWIYEYPEEEIEIFSYMIGSPGTAIPEELEGTFSGTNGNPELTYAYNKDVQTLLEHYGHDREQFLLATDTRVYVPVDANVHLLITANDVIHNWAIPSFGVKMDAMPGRINETWFRATEIGTYYGQCSELCGQAHSYMPIVVEVVSQEDYDAWVQQTQAAQHGEAAVQTAEADQPAQ
ncbi:MAG: cytochrome c oxidase subunit II [Pseudomonadota bacterium]